MSAAQTQVYDVFKQFSRLYEIRNSGGGQLDPQLQREWVEVTFTLDSIFSGLYRPGMDTEGKPETTEMREHVPVEFLRVPVDVDVLCETGKNFFSGKLRDISVGGAYVHSPVPFHIDSSLRITFCTFRDRLPLEVEGRIAWSNPGGLRKHTFPEGAGIQFTNCGLPKRSQIREYVYELVEETLARANLI